MTPQNQQQGQQIQSVGGTDAVRDQDKIMLILSYIGILALIPLLTVKDSDYVKWHAKQGLVLGGGYFVVAIGISILSMIVGFLGVLHCVSFPSFLVLTVVAIMKALNGTRWRIPVIADIADKL